MAKKPLNIGMIGYGFMGRAHSNAWRKVGNFFGLEYQPVLKAVAARNQAKAADFAARWGYESIESDWRDLVARDDIDAIDICVPNDLHMDIAIAVPKLLFPLPGGEFMQAVTTAKRVFVVEVNYTGQLAGLLRREVQRPILSISKADGQVFTASEVVSRIEKVIA